MLLLYLPTNQKSLVISLQNWRSNRSYDDHWSKKSLLWLKQELTSYLINPYLYQNKIKIIMKRQLKGEILSFMNQFHFICLGPFTACFMVWVLPLIKDCVMTCRSLIVHCLACDGRLSHWQSYQVSYFYILWKVTPPLKIYYMGTYHFICPVFWSFTKFFLLFQSFTFFFLFFLPSFFFFFLTLFSFFLFLGFFAFPCSLQSGSITSTTMIIFYSLLKFIQNLLKNLMEFLMHTIELQKFSIDFVR